MLRRIWLYPPLAVARLGSADEPLECFTWAPNDVRPRGTGKTTIRPAETLRVQPDGSVDSYVPKEVHFKDGRGFFKPVCPFYELHAEWEAGPKIKQGPVTAELLERFGLAPRSLVWTVRVANLKPFHMTLNRECRISATVEIRGDDTGVTPLEGMAPSDLPATAQPLVPPGKHLPLGSVRLTRPTKPFPELRLRFTPAKGQFYGPPNLKKRWVNEQGHAVNIPDENLCLNQKSVWCSWIFSPDDHRTNPDRLYAGERIGDGSSLGVVDDVCDGIISCRIEGLDLAPAYARVTVGPPDYAPDRRPFVTLADDLKDKVARAEVFDPDYVRDRTQVEREITDLMERILETMAPVNVDVFNNRVDVQENPEIAFAKGIPYKSTDHYAFVPPVPIDGRKFPLTERGRQFHRRFISIEIFKEMLRETPELIRDWIREPFSDELFFTKKMPPVMRDSSGGPLHLTRQQYDLLVLWSRKLREKVEGGS